MTDLYSIVGVAIKSQIYNELLIVIVITNLSSFAFSEITIFRGFLPLYVRLRGYNFRYITNMSWSVNLLCVLRNHVRLFYIFAPLPNK